MELTTVMKVVSAVDTGNNTLPHIQHDEVWTPEVVQRVVTLSVLMILTLFGNIAIIAFLTTNRYRKLHSRVNIFIVNLAIGDLTVFSFTMTTELLFVVFEKSWVLGNVACKLILYVQIITLASTTFILTAMSIDRYMAICKPLSIGSLSSRPRKMIAVSWLLAFLFASPQLLIFKQEAVGVYPDGEIRYRCVSRGYTAWWQRKVYFTFMACYILVVPTLIISFCYINVARVVWRQGQETSNRNGIALRRVVKDKDSIPKAKLKTVKMTLSIICTFIACWTPYFVVHLIHIWSEYQYVIPRAVYAFAETTAFLNSALNPVIYGFFNIRLRRRMGGGPATSRTMQEQQFSMDGMTHRSRPHGMDQASESRSASPSMISTGGGNGSGKGRSTGLETRPAERNSGGSSNRNTVSDRVCFEEGHRKSRFRLRVRFVRPDKRSKQEETLLSELVNYETDTKRGIQYK